MCCSGTRLLTMAAPGAVLLTQLLLFLLPLCRLMVEGFWRSPSVGVEHHERQCVYNGRFYQDGQTVVKIPEACADLVCQGARVDLQPQEQCSCRLPSPEGRDQGQQQQHVRMGQDPALSYRRLWATHCYYNRKVKNVGETVATLSSNCLYVSCQRSRWKAVLQTFLMPDCRCQDSQQPTEGSTRESTSSPPSNIPSTLQPSRSHIFRPLKPIISGVLRPFQHLHRTKTPTANTTIKPRHQLGPHLLHPFNFNPLKSSIFRPQKLFNFNHSKTIIFQSVNPNSLNSGNPLFFRLLRRLNHQPPYSASISIKRTATCHVHNPTTSHPEALPTSHPPEQTASHPSETTTSRPMESTTFQSAQSTSVHPTDPDTIQPVEADTFQPTSLTTLHPTEPPTSHPTEPPTPQSTEPTDPKPTELPTPQPTELNNPQPTELPTPQPTELNDPQPTELPTPQPTELNDPQPTELPTPQTTEPTDPQPTEPPTQLTGPPTSQSTEPPTPQPTEPPTPQPTEPSTPQPTEPPTPHSRETTNSQSTEPTTPQPPCDYSAFDSFHSMTLEPNTNCLIGRSGVTRGERLEILRVHNTLRAKVAGGEESQGDPGPQPSAANMRVLRWNEELATVAQAWANQCIFDHDSGDERRICSRDYQVGQNLYYQWGNDPTANWDRAIRQWYSEVTYLPSTYVDRYQPKASGKDIGHYGQVVWAVTREVGCGAVYYLPFMGGTSRVYVCNYGPRGNWLNRPMYQRGPPASACGPGESSQLYPHLCD